jgi:hypothetical protein
MFTLSLTLALMAVGQPAKGGFVATPEYAPDGNSFSLLVSQDTIFKRNSTVNQSLASGTNNDWPTFGSLTERSPILGNDQLVASGSARHDANLLGLFTYGFDVSATGNNNRSQAISATGMNNNAPHGNGFDQFSVSGTVQVAGGIANGDILGYNFVLMGKHVASSSEERTASLFTGQGSPGGQPFGSAALIFDDTTHNFDISLVTNGLMLSDITGSSLRLGDGTVIFDLGGSSQWMALSSDQLGRVVFDAPFPTPYIQDLLAGNVFVDVQTSNSANEISGQLVPQVLVPEPSAVLEMSTGLLILLASSSVITVRRRRLLARAARAQLELCAVQRCWSSVGASPTRQPDRFSR